MLPIGDAAVRRPRPRREVRAGVAASGPLRVTAGPQAERFGDELYRARYTVMSEESNRMGLRLRGPAIPSPAGHMLTEGVPLGAIQVPPDGQPIILFVEHQTTGGYPKPANVISADFWRLGQLRPRDRVTFERVTIEQALRLLREQEAMAVRHCEAEPMIDLNCDMGELEDAAHEAALMEYITSANIACGGHAGDDATMERTARLALERGVRIGAHPGYPDRANFGRLEMPMTPAEIADTVREQIERLDSSGSPARRRASSTSSRTARSTMSRCAMPKWRARSAKAWRNGIAAIPIFGLAGIADARRVARDGADGRSAKPSPTARYEPDGTLRNRKFSDALIPDPQAAAAQAVRLARGGTAETICVHGDTPGSVEILKACREALEALN